MVWWVLRINSSMKGWVIAISMEVLPACFQRNRVDESRPPYLLLYRVWDRKEKTIFESLTDSYKSKVIYYFHIIHSFSSQTSTYCGIIKGSSVKLQLNYRFMFKMWSFQFHLQRSFSLYKLKLVFFVWLKMFQIRNLATFKYVFNLSVPYFFLLNFFLGSSARYLNG